MQDNFYKFYNKSIDERRNILKNLGMLDDSKNLHLEKDIANSMVENYVLNQEMPLGLGLNFIINNKKYIVPMVTEEPSVIAAASNGAKTLGNIQTFMEQKEVIGQIVLEDINNIDKAFSDLEKNKKLLFELAEENSQNMIKRGGGPRKIWIEKFCSTNKNYLTIYLSVDTCDAMGANTINTILEAISPKVEEITGGKFLLRIISNNAVNSIVKAKAEIDVIKLNADFEKAKMIAKRIESATEYANLDVFRAVTHNKGIMNGIDSVVLATGNDFRAVESACHSYAVKDGQYKSLTKWKYDEERNILLGEIELPLQVATLGGTISINKIAKWSLDILGNPNAKELAGIIASVGLAQNFSALKAIVTDGIQKGHMSLHAKTVAKQVGAKEEEIDKLVSLLKKEDKINQEVAEKLLNKIRNDKNE